MTTPNDTTPEAIALRLVGAGDTPLFVEARHLVAEGIREDRRSRAPAESVREVLRDVAKGLLARAEEARRRGAEAGDRHDSDGADDADEEEGTARAAAAAVLEAVDALPGRAEGRG